MYLLRPSDRARFQAALWVGLALEAGDGVGAPRRRPLGRTSPRWPRSSRSASATSCRCRPIRYVWARISTPPSACEWRRTTRASPKMTHWPICCARPPCAGMARISIARPGASRVAMISILSTHRGRVHAAAAAGRGLLALVRSVPAAADRKEAGNVVRARDRHRSHGRQDRASRRASISVEPGAGAHSAMPCRKRTIRAFLPSKRPGTIWPRAFPILLAIIWASIGSRASPFSRSTKRNERTGSRYPLVA